MSHFEWVKIFVYSLSLVGSFTMILLIVQKNSIWLIGNEKALSLNCVHGFKSFPRSDIKFAEIRELPMSESDSIFVKSYEFKIVVHEFSSIKEVSYLGLRQDVDSIGRLVIRYKVEGVRESLQMMENSIETWLRTEC